MAKPFVPPSADLYLDTLNPQSLQSEALRLRWGRHDGIRGFEPGEQPTLAVVGKALGISGSTISRWEKDARRECETVFENGGYMDPSARQDTASPEAVEATLVGHVQAIEDSLNKALARIGIMETYLGDTIKRVEAIEVRIADALRGKKKRRRWYLLWLR
jgi:hypothetical protein